MSTSVLVMGQIPPQAGSLGLISARLGFSIGDPTSPNHSNAIRQEIGKIAQILEECLGSAGKVERWLGHGL